MRLTSRIVPLVFAAQSSWSLILRTGPQDLQFPVHPLWTKIAKTSQFLPSEATRPPGRDQPQPQTSGESFSITEQDKTLCDAQSRHFTGTVNVTGDKSMFFWYFESRNNPETAPVVLWMNGGPGATGVAAVFNEAGPCRVNADGNSTSSNKYSWTNHANVIFVDQPIGIGFSSITDRKEMAITLEQGSHDIYSFLETFSRQVFPGLADRTWHIAGESMGGHYTTGYVYHILKLERARRDMGLAPRLPFSISSIIAMNAYVDDTRSTSGYYDLFCLPNGKTGEPLMNETQCETMLAAVPECERLGRLCRDTYDIDVCAYASGHCSGTVGSPFFEGVKIGGWDPYDVRKTCEASPPLCSADMNNGREFQYMNQHWVQDLLGIYRDPFYPIDFDIFERWGLAKTLFLPTTRELGWILDESNVRVVFINGNTDVVMNTPGQLRILDEQPWHRQALYRARNLQDWHFQDGTIQFGAQSQGFSKGGQFKSEEQLTVFTVDEAGHFCSHDNPEAVDAVLAHWLGSSARDTNVLWTEL